MNNFKKARTLRGYTQKDIAKAINVSEPTYNRYENGVTDPDLQTLSSIAHFLNVTSDYLLGNSSIPFEIDYSSIQTESGKLRSNISSKLVHLSEEDLRALSHIVDKMLNK